MIECANLCFKWIGYNACIHDTIVMYSFLRVRVIESCGAGGSMLMMDLATILSFPHVVLCRNPDPIHDLR